MTGRRQATSVRNGGSFTATELAQELYLRYVELQWQGADQSDITSWDRLPEFLKNDWRRVALYAADLLGYDLTEEPTQEEPA